MDFDYSHFVWVSAPPSPTGGPAERPAPLIVSVSGLIEPNGNGCCQSSLFSSVYILIHKRDVHYSLTENSSRRVHKHTRALTLAAVLIKGWRCQWAALTAGLVDATGNYMGFLMVFRPSSQRHYLCLTMFSTSQREYSSPLLCTHGLVIAYKWGWRWDLLCGWIIKIPLCQVAFTDMSIMVKLSEIRHKGLLSEHFITTHAPQQGFHGPAVLVVWLQIL